MIWRGQLEVESLGMLEWVVDRRGSTLVGRSLPPITPHRELDVTDHPHRKTCLMDAQVHAPAKLDTHAKALAVNLDATLYGSIAEIGAGQEVARWFLTAGAASGTVAQTISAYDKTFSDATYGAGTRYVSRERLGAMLDREYGLLVERLGAERGATTRFFAFADTAATRNYKGDNEQQAWVGVRFQTEPGSQPSDIILHVNLTAHTAHLQQQALGVLGVNLIHAISARIADSDGFRTAVWEDLTLDHLEIDVLEMKGLAFAGVDRRTAVLSLVRCGMARAVVFDPAGEAVEPASVLRKRPLIVERGRLAATANYHEPMLQAAREFLASEGPELHKEPFGVLEYTIKPVWGEAPSEGEMLGSIGHSGSGAVVISDFGEAHLLAGYLRRYTHEPVRFAMTTPVMALLLAERFARPGQARVLENLGKLLAFDVRIYVYPTSAAVLRQALGADVEEFELRATSEELVTADDLIPRPPVIHLYRYLREAGWVVPIGPGK